MALRQRVLSQHKSQGQPRTRIPGLLARRIKLAAARKRLRSEAMQFPSVVRLLSLLLANGLPPAVAIQWLSPRLSGFWGVQLQGLSKRLELGADLVAELERLAIDVPLIEVAEFTEKLSTAIERGVPISEQLSALALSLEASMIRDLTKRSGVNETKMLIPTVFLILPVTVLFAVFPSLLVLQASY